MADQPYTEADVKRVRLLIAMPSEVLPREWDREPYPRWAARAILADLAAAGRLLPEGPKISEVLDAEAERLRAEHRGGNYGIEYVNGWEDAAARAERIEKGSTDG